MKGDEPGTVAVATVRGVPNVRVFCYRVRSGECQWDSAERVHGSISHGDADVTDVRPLVVLDLADPRAAAAQLRGRDDEIGYWNALIADQIEQQTKPPKPAEPTGLGAVVEDAEGKRWVRHEHDPGRLGTRHAWYPAGYVGGTIRIEYADIDAVRVLSDGVQP